MQTNVSLFRSEVCAYSGQSAYALAKLVSGALRSPDTRGMENLLRFRKGLVVATKSPEKRVVEMRHIVRIQEEEVVRVEDALTRMLLRPATVSDASVAEADDC